MTWILLVFSVLCVVAIYLNVVHLPQAPVVYTSRNQTVVNNGELVITAADAGSVSVRSTDDVIIVTYKRKRFA